MSIHSCQAVKLNPAAAPLALGQPLGAWGDSLMSHTEGGGGGGGKQLTVVVMFVGCLVFELVDNPNIVLFLP